MRNSSSNSSLVRYCCENATRGRTCYTEENFWSWFQPGRWASNWQQVTPGPRLPSQQGRNDVFKVGSPISWSRLLYRTKYGWYTQFSCTAVCYVTVITLFIKKVGVVRPNFGGPDPPTPHWLRPCFPVATHCCRFGGIKLHCLVTQARVCQWASLDDSELIGNWNHDLVIMDLLD